MKRTFFIAFLVFSAVALNSAWGSQDGPADFRGIKWGTLITDAPDMVLLPGPTGNEGIYTKKADPLQMGETGLEAVKYGFYKNKFYMGIIEFKSLFNFKKLKNKLEEELGSGKQTNLRYQQYFWDWPDVSVSIYYRLKKDEGTIIYYYKPIEKQKK